MLLNTRPSYSRVVCKYWIIFFTSSVISAFKTSDPSIKQRIIVENNTGTYQYDPRKFLYRTGDRPISQEEELIEVAEQIKKEL